MSKIAKPVVTEEESIGTIEQNLSIEDARNLGIAMNDLRDLNNDYDDADFGQD
jgi:hypothetical protein